jgi:hypothetical protein
MGFQEQVQQKQEQKQQKQLQRRQSHMLLQRSGYLAASAASPVGVYLAKSVKAEVF